jgi:uncharacterized membrane-anchored protein
VGLLRLLTILLLFAGYAQAQQPTPLSAQERQTEQQAAWRAAAQAATRGPAVVPLRGEAKLTVPEGMAFIPVSEATRLMRAMGNSVNSDLVGIVTRFDNDADWMVIVKWQAEGYVRDDEAGQLDAGQILDSLREGTEQANGDRRARGFAELEVVGWAEPPHYDATAHRLVWAVKVKDKGDADDQAAVNFNTRALGREGFFSLNLLTDLDALERNRPVSATLLSNLEFDPGKRYADFNASTDRVAAYGLAGLIGVVLAKKLGLLALVGLFLAKFAKAGLLAVAGAGLAIKRLFGRKPAT